MNIHSEILIEKFKMYLNKADLKRDNWLIMQLYGQAYVTYACKYSSSFHILYHTMNDLQQL